MGIIARGLQSIPILFVDNSLIFTTTDLFQNYEDNSHQGEQEESGKMLENILTNMYPKISNACRNLLAQINSGSYQILDSDWIRFAEV